MRTRLSIVAFLGFGGAAIGLALFQRFGPGQDADSVTILSIAILWVFVLAAAVALLAAAPDLRLPRNRLVTVVAVLVIAAPNAWNTGSFVATRVTGPTGVAARMAPACAGHTAIAGAAEYRGSSHPMVVLDASGATGPWTQKAVDLGWQADAQSTQLVACVGPEQKKAIQSCSYDMGGVLTRYSWVREFDVVEAKTGQVIGTTFASGTDPESCPLSKNFGDTERVGGHVGWDGPDTWSYLATWTTNWPDPQSKGGRHGSALVDIGGRSVKIAGGGCYSNHGADSGTFARFGDAASADGDYLLVEIQSSQGYQWVTGRVDGDGVGALGDAKVVLGSDGSGTFRGTNEGGTPQSFYGAFSCDQPEVPAAAIQAAAPSPGSGRVPSASLTVGGQTTEISGGLCYVTLQGRLLEISIGAGPADYSGNGLQIGQPLDGSEPATISAHVGSQNYIATSNIVSVEEDGSGSFRGLDIVTHEPVQGTFNCETPLPRISPTPVA